MVATMSANGVITLEAETSVEAFALRTWIDRALIHVDDTQRGENCHWRGSMLIVTPTVPAKDSP